MQCQKACYSLASLESRQMEIPARYSRSMLTDGCDSANHSLERREALPEKIIVITYSIRY